MMLLRSLLFNIWFFGGTVVIGLFGVAVRFVAPHRALMVAQLWARWSLLGARLVAGIEVEVTGREWLPTDGPALVASQHQSAFDTLVWLALVPRASYVAKSELVRVPLFGPLLKPGGQIIVDRTAGAAAIRQLVRGAKRAAADGRTIVIFPEGTRVGPGASAPLRSGIAVLASQLQLPVIPVATDSGRLWGRRAFRKRSGVIHLAVGRPIPFDLPRAELVSRVEAAWAELLPTAP